MAAKRSPGRVTRGRGKAAATQSPRVAAWLERHPGADNPRSKNYDPNWHQRARGHKPKEHVTRAERAAAEGKSTSRDRQYMSRVAKGIVRRTGRTPEEVKATLEKIRAERGMEAIEAINRDHVANRKRKRKRNRVWMFDPKANKQRRVEVYGSGRADVMAEMQAMAAKYGVPVDYFWYH